MDDIARILGSIIGGVADGALENQRLEKSIEAQNQRLNKTIQAQEDIALLKDSLSVKNTQQLNQYNRENALLSDSLGVKNAMLEDSLDTERMIRADSLANERHEDTQRFQKGNQATQILSALMPQMTATQNLELENEKNRGQFKYNSIKEKVSRQNADKANARQWSPDLKKLNKQTLQFRTEKPFPFSESDMLDSYENARENLEGTVLESLKLPAGDKKRRAVRGLIDKLHYRANNPDFLDGDWGIFGGRDPDGSEARGIKDELKIWLDLLNDEEGSARYLDEIYGITPEERMFYDNWGEASSAISEKQVSNTKDTQEKMYKMLEILLKQSE